MMKLQRIIGNVIINDIKTRQIVETIPYNMVVGSRKMVNASFKIRGLYQKYNTNNYVVEYQYNSVENIPFELDYGIRSIGKIIKK